MSRSSTTNSDSNNRERPGGSPELGHPFWNLWSETLRGLGFDNSQKKDSSLLRAARREPPTSRSRIAAYSICFARYPCGQLVPGTYISASIQSAAALHGPCKCGWENSRVPIQDRWASIMEQLQVDSDSFCECGAAERRAADEIDVDKPTEGWFLRAIHRQVCLLDLIATSNALNPWIGSR